LQCESTASQGGAQQRHSTAQRSKGKALRGIAWQRQSIAVHRTANGKALPWRSKAKISPFQSMKTKTNERKN
jgi:hypothetical protein